MPRRVSPILLLILLPFAGCQKADIDPRVEAPPEPDTPLVLKANARGQVQVGGKWRDLFSDHDQIRAWLKSKSEQYRQVYAQRELSLPTLRTGPRREEFLPVPVILQIEPKTKSGYVGALKRACREFGFVQFEETAMED